MIKHMFILLVWVKLVTVEAMVMCDGVLFRKEYYDKHVLFEGLGRPNNLVMHKPTGNLFFSHTIRNGSEVDFGIMICHIERKKCRDVPGVLGGYAITWDRGNNIIFLGGHDGIYKYNFISNSVSYFAEKGKSIWNLFARRNFYYIRYPTQKLYVYANRTFIRVPEAENFEIDNFFVTQNLMIFFSNRTGLYKVNKPNRETLLLKENINVKQITYDIHGDIYFGASDGIYVTDKRRRKVKKVADIEKMYGMAFYKAGDTEKNKKKRNYEVIYSDDDTIYMLLPSQVGKICMSNSSLAVL